MEASDRNDSSATEGEQPAESRKMDITKVYMVRSAKGSDMLCVDDFLYHYDDCSSKSYRWVCNRRKDKVAMCRSRIITTIVDGDQSKHQVLKVNNEHTHGRCSAKEIFKAYERKRLADLAGAPCTLENKMLKRKLQRMEDASAKKRKQDSDAESDGDFHWPEEDEHSSKVSARNIKKERRHEPTDDSNSAGNSFDFNQGSLYLLKTPLGRQMICIDGFLYRLEGKSLTSSTHRWECIKQSEEPCKVRILTEHLPSGSHRLKGSHDAQHNHEAFMPWKLSKLLHKNNITVLSKLGEPQAKNTTESMRDFEEVTFESNIDAKRTCTTPVSEVKQKRRTVGTHTHGTRASCLSRAKSPMKTIKTDRTDDPLAAPPDAPKNQPDKSKISFLPSAKGNQVLCLDNFIYHYDSRSPHNGRSYWTCILRRNKFFKCNARVTTQMTDKGPVVARLSGAHMHPDNSQDIKRRLQKSIMKDKNGRSSAKSGESLKSTLRDLGRSSKAVLAKSRQAIERKMGRLRRKVQEGLAAEGKYKELESDVDETSSSFSSALNSDDDDNVTLPTKLEEMYEGDALRTYDDEKDGGGGAKIETIYDTACDDLIEEVGIDEEYLEPTHYKDPTDFLEYEQNEPTKIEDEPQENQEVEKETEPSAEFGHEMDLNKLSILRSVKGGEMLCVDGYIYHWKSATNDRNYWSCIKYKDGVLKCKGRVSTTMTPKGIKVVKVTNYHTHPVDETEIRRRMCTEILRSEASDLKPNEVIKMPLHELSDRYAHLVANCAGQQWTGLQTKREIGTRCEGSATMKLYAVSDGPPSLAVRMALKALNIPFELVNVDYIASEHLSEQYAKMNPQKEIPVLDDNGFYLSESVAIMQYLCDKYAPESNLYPKDATERALVNHRLCFNMGFYYASIAAHSMAPIFFDYQRTDMSLKKVNNALAVFETYLQRAGTKYAAGAHITIADLALVSATLCLEAIGFDLSPYPLVKKWYATFKQEYPQLWEIANGGMQEIIEFEKNPPDLSHMNHPFHPSRKTKA